MSEGVDLDDRVLPRVCDESRLGRSVREAEPALMRQLNAYPALVEQRRAAVDPHLLALSDAAHLKAINRVLTNFGLAKENQTIAVEPDVPGPKPGALVFSGNPFGWIKRLFRRGG